MVSRRTRVASWIFRRDHPSRPKAMICCFFSSFKTFAMLREATSPPAAVNVLDVSSESMAAFQVFIYGRFWVFTEDMVTTWSIGPHQGSGPPRGIGEACKGEWLGDASIAHRGFASAGVTVRHEKALGLSGCNPRPQTVSLHPMAIEVGCFSAAKSR